MNSIFPPPGGPGPYFCTLLFNTGANCKKQTHLFAHTLPHLAIDVLNKTQSKDKRRARQQNDDCWVMMLKIGPFCRWDECCSFLQLWSDKTRGKEKRFNRGVELFWRYQASLNLQMWVQQKERDAAVHDAFHGAEKAELLPLVEELTLPETNTHSLTNLKDMFAAPTLRIQQIKEANAAVEPKRKKIKL
jgi:hypothetical protein